MSAALARCAATAASTSALAFAAAPRRASLATAIPKPQCGSDGDASPIENQLGYDRFAVPGGLAILMLPPRDMRFGLPAFEDTLIAAGFAYTMLPLDPRFLQPCYGDAAGLLSPAAREQALAGDGVTVTDDDVTTAGGYEARLRLFIVHWAAEEARA
jgi:hypothetical protein